MAIGLWARYFELKCTRSWSVASSPIIEDIKRSSTCTRYMKGEYRNLLPRLQTILAKSAPLLTKGKLIFGENRATAVRRQGPLELWYVCCCFVLLKIHHPPSVEIWAPAYCRNLSTPYCRNLSTRLLSKFHHPPTVKISQTFSRQVVCQSNLVARDGERERERDQPTAFLN